MLKAGTIFLRKSITILLVLILFSLAPSLIIAVGETLHNNNNSYPHLYQASSNQWVGCNITIHKDGSITPKDAPIVTNDNKTYTLTSDVVGSENCHTLLIIQRSNIIFNGNHHKIRNAYYGISVEAENITIKTQ